MVYSSTLKRETICSSKTTANYYQTTQNNRPEDGIIQYRRNVKEMMSGGDLTEFQQGSCNINKKKRSLKWLLKHWKVLLVLNFPCHKNVIIVCKLAYLQDTLKIAVNVTRLKEILKWNEDCMNGVNEYMYLITSSKHHWHFMQQNTQIFRT